MTRWFGILLIISACSPPLEPGDEFTDCTECPTMVVVPSGSFMMGSASNARQGVLDERPQHRVTISRNFAVGKFEVTFEEWDACVSAGGCIGNRGGDLPGWGRGKRPVIQVSWDDAKAYVSWLSRKTGESYRLLSEAEWEYAARAGTKTRYSWGNDIGRNRANCDGCGSQWDHDRTAPVGSFAANAFGLHDMRGNVSEWVEDCYHESYSGAPTNGSAWTSGSCDYRVSRGGSWVTPPRNLRSAARSRSTPADGDSGRGFRVSRTLD